MVRRPEINLTLNKCKKIRKIKKLIQWKQSFVNGEEESGWKEERDWEKKQIKIHHAQVQISYDEYEHYVYHKCTNNLTKRKYKP